MNEYLRREIMDIIGIIENKRMKRLQKRNILVEAIIQREIQFSEIDDACHSLPNKSISLILEAIEEVSRSKVFVLEENYLHLAEKYILANDNSCKREASRIVGNLASKYPNILDTAIEALIQNTQDEGTVIRWGSAYALSRIIVIPQYANSSLFERIQDLCEKENENGVKNQYVKAIKKAEKLR